MNTIVPEEVGLSSQRLEQLQQVMQSFVDQRYVAGLVTLIARRGKIVHFEGYGNMDREAATPMRLDTIFRLASMTKPITTVALLMLVEEGRVTLTDPVSKFIPEFANLKVFVRSAETGVEVAELTQLITVKDLLAHTAGLTYDFLVPSPIRELYEQAGLFGALPHFQLQMPVAELVRRVAELPLVCQPGQAWSYGVATDVVGHLVSLIADMPFATFVQERIFEPLGMSDAAFYVPQDKLARFATAYRLQEGKLLSVETPAATPYANQDCYANGGSGLVSTTLDYFRFAQMLLNRGALEGVRILSPKTVDLMTRNHVPHALLPLWFGNLFPFPGVGFGLGVQVLLDAAQAGVLESEGTFGWGGLWGTSFRVDPQEELICLLMKQLDIFSLVPVYMDGIFSTLAYTALEA